MDLFNLIKNNKFDELYDFIKNNLDYNYDIYDSNFNYFIHYIVILNQYKILDLILKNIKIKIDILDVDGHSLLYYPIKYNNIKILEILLEYEKNIIGIKLIDLQDNSGNTPLHYSCIFNNFESFKILYNYKANINIFDNIKKYNIFQNIIEYKRLDILEYLLDNITDFNIKTKNNETLLQILITSSYDKFIDKMLTKNLNLNNQEFDYGLTALHQSIILNKTEIAKKLINHGSNINLQDNLGNNSIHYGIIEKNFNYILYVFKYDINYNMTNLNGNTYLHLLLLLDITFSENDKFNTINILLQFIKNTDLNIQNSNGETCLHLIVENNLWYNLKIKEYLSSSSKELNIYITNNNKENVIEKISDQNNINELLEIVINNYYNNLVQEKDKKKFIVKWEYYCSKNDLKNIMKELNKRTELESSILCKNKIKEIVNIEKRSVPKVNEINFIIDNGIYMENLFYTGSVLDILFGILWLRQEHSNINLLLNYPLTKNNNLEKHYKLIGINKSKDFHNIEILWSFQKIIFQENFDSIFKSKNKNEFLIIPLGIEINNGSHANIILIDNINKKIERFEPNGSIYPKGFYYNPKLLDTILKNKFESLISEYSYLTPEDYEPIIGLQVLETSENFKNKKIGDPNGFCAIWCVWWINQRIYNKNEHPKEIINSVIKQIKLQNKSFKNVIRNFSQNIVKLRDTFLQKNNLNIHQWLLEDISNEQFDNLEQDIISIL